MSELPIATPTKYLDDGKPPSNDDRDRKEALVIEQRTRQTSQIKVSILAFLDEGHSLHAAYAKYVDTDANLRGYGGPTLVKSGKLTTREWATIRLELADYSKTRKPQDK